MSDHKTLSQALRHVKKLKGQLADFLTRAQNSVTHKEDSPPAFFFHESLEKTNSIRKELIEYQTRIAITNAITSFTFNGAPMTLVCAVHTLQEFKSTIKWYKDLAVRDQENSKETEWSYDSRGERVQSSVHWYCAMPEARRADALEQLQNQFDSLNDAVEKVNHTTVLMHAGLFQLPDPSR